MTPGAGGGYRCFAVSVLATAISMMGCDGTAVEKTPDPPLDEQAPPYRNIETPTAYVGDEACISCHAGAAAAYEQNTMAQSFHPWTPATRIETPSVEPLVHGPSGYAYAVVDIGGQLFQEEYVLGPDGRRLHELRRRMDYVMGSGNVARTYFTDENGRLFQLPLTWYRHHGWDFSPGYEINNARFDRLMPNQCVACHGSYPSPLPFLEGKYEELRPGIGCERCHGPGALHVEERALGPAADSTYDDTIVNPADLPFERRLDVCEQCHVHAPVTVLREGHDEFDYRPSLPLSDHAAFFRASGSIDIVSHADRLRQSACFRATRRTAQPLECATCHNPHVPTADLPAQNRPCQACHDAAPLAQRLASSPAGSDHGAGANCVGCHMPAVQERTVPHGSFTDHWIRVVTPEPGGGELGPDGAGPVDPYYAIDATGPVAPVYRSMGEVVFATRASDARRLADAASMLDRALGADSVRGDAHFLLGLAYSHLGRNEDAVRALERAVRAGPEEPQRLYALAQAYEQSGRDPGIISRLYERALELQPALAWIRADYADHLQAHGRRGDAEVAYREALAERPSLEVAAFNLGTLLTGQGRLEEASEAFGQAVRLDPSLADALNPLLYIRTTGDTIRMVRTLGSPLATLPSRGRGPNAVRLAVATGAREPGVVFANLPPGAVVQILEPSGGVVRLLPAGEGSARIWDLRADAGVVVAGGLYRVRVSGPGSPPSSRLFSFGVVRVRAE